MRVLDQGRFGTTHIPKFGGELWYVNKGAGDDNFSGKDPDAAFETFGAAITACAAGDAINVKAGTYVEDSIVLNKNAVEIWAEIGTILTPSGASTCLQVTGNDCRIRGVHTLKASQIGFDIDGAGCALEDCLAEDGTIGYDIDGAETTFSKCRSINCTTTGFDIATAENFAYLCVSISNTTSRGFYLSGSGADYNVLDFCISDGNQTAGFEIVTGAAQNIIAHCSTGGGDGRWVDADRNSTFSDFTYADIVDKEVEVDSAQTINLFEVTGTVKISNLHGVVTEIVTTGGAPTIHLSVIGTNEVDITDDPGPNIADDVVGTVYVRNAASGTALAKGENDNAVFIIENGAFNNPEVPVIVGADDDTTSYVRFNSNAALTDGKIVWHCKWSPISDSGFVKPA